MNSQHPRLANYPAGAPAGINGDEFPSIVSVLDVDDISRRELRDQAAAK